LGGLRPESAPGVRDRGQEANQARRRLPLWDVARRHSGAERGDEAGAMTATDIIVRRAIRICDTLAYFSLAWKGEQVITFVRTFGKRGTGLWLRQVLHRPESGDKCGCPICRWERY